jgi:hypothetical protein
MTEMTIELAPFRLADGVTEAELLEASEALQRDFLAGQDGFVRRELLRGKDGSWCDLVYWRDAASAERIMSAVAGSAVCHRYFNLMAGADAADPAAGVQHFVVKRRYE